MLQSTPNSDLNFSRHRSYVDSINKFDAKFYFGSQTAYLFYNGQPYLEGRMARRVQIVLQTKTPDPPSRRYFAGIAARIL